METKSNQNFLIRDNTGDIHPVIDTDSLTVATVTISGAGGPPFTSAVISTSTNSISAGKAWNFDRVTIDDIEFNESAIWSRVVGTVDIGIVTTSPTDLSVVDGSVTATGSGTFGTIVVDSGSITDSSGAISFGDENLTTTGFADIDFLSLNGVKTLHTDAGGVDNLFLGETAGAGITSGARNTVVGMNSGAAITEGVDNTIIGAGSGTSLTVGDKNVLIGRNVANSLTEGSSNFVMGASAAIALTTGSNNIIFGTSAATAMTTADSNILIGVDAGDGIVSADGSICIGESAGSSLATGLGNILIGKNAGRDLSLASGGNTAVGLSALLGAAGQTTNNNTAMGSLAMDSITSGDDNCGFGRAALASVTSGGKNVAVGLAAGNGISTTSDNICIGDRAGSATNAFSKVICIGSDSVATASNQLIFGSVTGEVTDGYFGEGPVAASPGDFTFHGTGGSGTDNPAGDLFFSVGQSTGNSDPGSMIFQTTVAGASSSTPQTLTKLLTLDSGIFTVGASAAAGSDNMMVNSSGGIDFGSNLAGLSSGHMGQEDAPTTITIGTINVDVIVDGMLTGILTNGMVFQNAQEFKVAQAGTYQVMWQISFQMASGANQEVEGAVYVNLVRQDLTSAHRTIGTAADTGSMSGVGLVDLAVDDLVSVHVRNESSTANIVIEHANVILTQISGPDPG